MFRSTPVGLALLFLLLLLKSFDFLSIAIKTWPLNFLEYKLNLSVFAITLLLLTLFSIGKSTKTYLKIVVGGFIGAIIATNVFSTRGYELLIATGYTLSILTLAKVATRATGRDGLPIRMLFFIIINLIVSIILNSLGALNKTVISIIALGGLFSVTETRNLLENTLETSSTFLKIILLSSIHALGFYAGLLMNQPIIEWDSSVGHIPTVLHYFHSSSLSGFNYNIQTYAYNIHHIGSLPFFGIGSAWGLKFWNFLNVLAIFAGILNFLKALSYHITEFDLEDRLLTALLIVTPSIIFSTIGTFQYDVPILLYTVLIISLFNRIYTDVPNLNSFYFLLILIASALSVATKLSFVVISPLLACLVLWPYIKARRFPWTLLVTASSIVLILLSINLIRSGKLFFPYDFIAYASRQDWKSYGYGLGYIFDLLTFIPGIALNSSKFGHLHDGTASIAGLLALIAVFDLWKKRQYRTYIVLFFIALSIAILPTRYIRYSLFVWALFPLFIYLWLKEIDNRKQKYAKLIACFILVLQISLIPSLNWWIKMPGQIFLGNYNESSALEILRGKDLKDLQEISVLFKDETKVFISKVFASRFYWVNMLYPAKIIPLTWQSGIILPSPQSTKEMEHTLDNFKASHFIVPRNEIEPNSYLKTDFKTVYKNDTYMLFSR